MKVDIDKAKFLEEAGLTATLLEWMTLHGNLCLGLRHPENQGPSREFAIRVRDRIAALLIEREILTLEEVQHANAVECAAQRMHRS
jgi:hypothetical protein